MRAIELKTGDTFFHGGLNKLPSELVVRSVEVTKRKIIVTPAQPWSAYKITFQHNQKIKQPV